MNRNLIIAIVVIALIIIGFTLYWQFSDTGVPNDQSASVLDSQNQEVRIVTALHQFQNGQHIVAGEADLPTPCHVLNHEVVVTQSNPQDVLINFTTPSNDADICAQVITAARYKIEFQAGENAVIRATWNGAPVQFNLVPVPEGDDLNNFDIFIKG